MKRWMLGFVAALSLSLLAGGLAFQGEAEAGGAGFADGVTGASVSVFLAAPLDGFDAMSGKVVRADGTGLTVKASKERTKGKWKTIKGGNLVSVPWSGVSYVWHNK